MKTYLIKLTQPQVIRLIPVLTFGEDEARKLAVKLGLINDVTGQQDWMDVAAFASTLCSHIDSAREGDSTGDVLIDMTR